MGIAGSLAFALLTGGCLLAATAGPREVQATGERALEQTMTAVAPADRDIVVSSTWGSIKATLQAAPFSDALTEADIEEGVATQLRGDFGAGPLRLTPPSTDWMGLTAAPSDVIPRLPTLEGIPGELEVDYRYPLGGNLRLVAGSMPDTAPSPTSTETTETFHLQVVVTPQTARQFGLRPGSQLPVGAPQSVSTAAGKRAAVDLDVTGIVEPANPDSSFWAADPLLPAPTLDGVGGGESWDGGVIADPGEFYTMLQIFGDAGLRVQWDFPTSITSQPGQPQAVFNQANQIVSQTPQLTGAAALLSKDLTVSYGLVQPLAAFISALTAVNAVLWLVYVGLAVAGIVTLLLAALMIADRRSAELTLLRARGASLWQLFSLGSRGAALACVPAAALAWAGAVLLVPAAGPAGPARWWPGIAMLAFAVLSPGAVGTWQHRLRRRRPVRRRRRWLPRVTFEVTACAAAIGGIAVFRAQAGQADLYTSAAPVLVAVPTVIIALRLYQVLLRGLARASARERGLIGFLALTRAAQAPLTLALPAMTLVLALTVAAFTGMARDAVVSGETAASWQTTGADVVVAAAGELGISPPAVRAVVSVPGVQHAASAVTVPVTVDAGSQVVTVIVVDPASYAALVASTPGFSPVNAALLSQPGGQGAVPVLASPQAAAFLGGRHGSSIVAQQGLPALRVRVAGQLQSTPALPAGGAFVVLPRSAIRGGSVPSANLILLTGPSIDLRRLNAVVQATIPSIDGPTVTTRSAALQELTGAPLQQQTFVLFTLAIAFAAALALAVLLLELALGAADREVTTARLATMGLTEGQRVRLVALEVVPSIAASAVAAAVCAVALPRLLAPAIDLSVFTHSQAPVPLRADFASFTLPLAGLLVITIIALAYEVRSGRGDAVTMRA
jgi:putative ABC transport system permease protein